jgi:hypothetical protein
MKSERERELKRSKQKNVFSAVCNKVFLKYAKLCVQKGSDVKKYIFCA